MQGRRNYAELDAQTPNIFVLGFAGTRGAFIRELVKYPEFGFITIEERDELLRRQKNAESGLPDDLKLLHELYNHIKRRVSNKVLGGFYKFYGYQEFVNRLFTSETVKLIDLETEAKNSGRTLEDLIYSAIERGDIQVNKELLDSFRGGSILICDELHNTYNTNMKNNYGVAIQFILDSVPDVKFVGMSATPINNSPTEVAEVINYLVLPHQKTAKKDLFSDNHNLREGAEVKIAGLVRGKISFLQDTNLKYFPRREYMGEMIKIPHEVGLSHKLHAGDTIPYLPFIRCPMSPLHQKTLNDAVAESGSYHGLPADAYTLFDMVFPEGLYKTTETRSRIGAMTGSSLVYLAKSGNTQYITGDFLLRENVGQYSTKAEKVLDILDEIFARAKGDPNKGEKVMIFHDRVRMSGVLLIQELLRMNGYVDETTIATDNTRCSICGATMKTHSETTGHTFSPARFVIAHSDIDKTTMNASLAKFNMADNRHGHKYKILIGSKIIKESYDFKDIQNMIIVAIPTNIPTLIQVFGRGDRKNSHINLPPSQRRIAIYILVSSVNMAEPALDTISPEEYRYIDKLSDYTTIQKIERIFHSVAIDADIHRDIIMPPDLYKLYFPAPGQKEPVDRLGNLYFEPETVLPIYKLEDLNLSTFHARGYDHEEIGVIMSIIKRLFMRQNIWSYDDLLAAVKAPPFGVEYNPSLFAEGNFIIALETLVEDMTAKMLDVSQSGSSSSRIINSLFDSSERVIYKTAQNGALQKYKIRHIDEFYILFPEGRYDVETYIRSYSGSNDIDVDINKYVKDSYEVHNFQIRRAKFIEKYTDSTNYVAMMSDYDDVFQRAMIEESIVSLLAGGGTIMHKRIIELYNRFGIILYADEVKRYKDTVKLYSEGVPSSRGAIGYESNKSVRLYDTAAQKWLDVSKAALNRHPNYKENNSMIGYFERAEDVMKFKLRNPVHAAKVSTTTSLRRDDSRLIEKGMVCGTQGKGTLIGIATKIGITKLDKRETRLKKICTLIKCRMLENEAKERQKESRTKWVYNWWDDISATN
jgi:hypothetical protein